MKKSIVCMLLIAAVVFSVFAVLPIHTARCEDDDPFEYSYPIVQNPDFAFVGELAPGESTPWVAVTVTFTGPATPPVTSIGPWQAEVTKNDGSKAYWIVTAQPGPTYTWPSLTSAVVVDIKVTVPADWTEECYHTFNVKLLGGKDSKTPTPRTISPGEGVHFKVCVKIPPQQVLSIECNSFMTDSSFNIIESFDTVWTPRDPKGRDYYKLSSTNPGQFMYNIWMHNNGNVDVESLTVTYTIPDDFILKGADPIQVWTGYGKTGTRIWTVTIDYDTHTITITSGLVVGAELWITFHLEYGPARETFSAAVMQAWKTNHPSYTFSADCIAYANGFDPATCLTSTILYDPTVVLGVEN
jgi:hypothetical protein